MTSFIQANGQNAPFAFNLTGIDAVEILASTESTQFQIECVWAAATGAADFRLWVDKGGGTEVNIIPSKTMAADDTVQVTNHPLRFLPGWSLKCSASVGNIIGVTVSLILISKKLNERTSL